MSDGLQPAAAAATSYVAIVHCPCGKTRYQVTVGVPLGECLTSASLRAPADCAYCAFDPTLRLTLEATARSSSPATSIRIDVVELVP